MISWDDELKRMSQVAREHGIDVVSCVLPEDIPGKFNGLCITVNSDYDAETRCHVLAHCFGHTVQWGKDNERYRLLYDRLYAAKQTKAIDPAAMDEALAEFRAYEEEASEYATWLWRESPLAAARFANYARADIEAIVGFHRDGTAPPWPQFWADWNDRVANHNITPQPFTPRPIPAFEPRLIPEQEVIQIDGEETIPESY